jgi:hypothetical protein
MDLRLTIKAVQSLQSFTPDVSDEVTIYGEILGIPVTVHDPSGDLLTKLDELLFALNQQKDADTSHPEQNKEYVDYHMAADYTLGGLVDD